MDILLEKLERLEKEYLELQNKLAEPAVIGDQNLYRDLSRRYKSLGNAARLAKEYRDATNSKVEAEEILNGTEKELMELAETQLEESKAKLVELEARAKVELLPKDPNDERDCIIEIRAAAGGDEAALFAGEISRMYFRFAEGKGFKVELMSKSEGAPDCIKEMVFAVRGENAYGIFKYESGVHRVQRVPVTENKGRVHTSTISVAVLPEAEEVDIAIRDQDLRVDVFRAGGHGGQSVNKTESAVRITHIPTGLVVICQDEKSQLKNKAQAMKVLRTRLYEMEEKRLREERGEQRSSQIGSGDRSEKIRTYNFPQDRLTDHRINKNYSNLPSIMEGNIGEIIEDLQMADQEEKLHSTKC